VRNLLIFTTALLPALLGNVLKIHAAQINVNAAQVLHPISPYLTGACIEDVNHEVYGGIYSQMIFGESFQEPATPEPLTGFTEYGGSWLLTNDVLFSASSPGPKLISSIVNQSSGDLKVQMRFTSNGGVDAGVIFQVTQPATGADTFNGYEVSLSPGGAYAVLGRHRQNYEQISQVPCAVPLNEWINLEVQYTNASIAVLVNGASVIQYTDTQHPLTSGQVGLRNYQQDVQFQNFQINGSNVTFSYDAINWPGSISGMWAPVSSGAIAGQCSMETSNPFVGSQSQRITVTSGTGKFGVANRGLNHWGMAFASGKDYEGVLDVRADAPTPVTVALESADGSSVYAQTSLMVTSNNWQNLQFSLTPSTSDTNGRVTISLTQPGSVVVGYAFLQPGTWGRFQNLPVRKDVADGLVTQGVTVLRYGGSMVNASAYRWKKMVGPRDRRPPYNGTWYPYSSDGWGIPDFLNFCEAAGFLAIPDLNVNETAQDMADFIQYVNGPMNTTWGAKRAADGHPQPYHLKYMELGNEERVDSIYYQKFQALATAIWAADPNIILVVGDFSYHQVITNPFSFSGADSGITTLAAQQQILQLAKQNGREVWFDLHVWTDGPRPDSTLASMFSYDTALASIAGGAKFRVAVFELNANNPSQKRAIANALAINAIERDGRLQVTTSANCLQPDGENDNGWDQGLLFLNPSQVWLQPPGYVTQMYSTTHQPQQVLASVVDTNNDFDASAQCSPDGTTLVLKVVNLNSASKPATINFAGFSLTNPIAVVKVLSASLDAANTAQNQMVVKPIQMNWQYQSTNNSVNYTFAPDSVTTIVFQGQLIPTTVASLQHRYSFNGVAGSTVITDSVGGRNGTFIGTSGGLDGAGDLILNGVDGYVDLGANLVADYTNMTVEAWMNVPANDATYARLFDFGDTDSSSGSGAYGMDFCPHANSTSWFEVFNTDPGLNSAVQLLGPSLSGIGPLHVVVNYDPQQSYAAVYTNGILEGNTSINYPFSSLVDAHNYLGKSGYRGDPYLTGTLSEFRIYSGILSAAQIAADYLAGPDTLTNIGSMPGTTALKIVMSGGNAILTWPSEDDGYNVEMTPSLIPGASWMALPESPSPLLTDNVYQIVLPATNPAAFYRLVK
jgi:hypothetical protein